MSVKEQIEDCLKGKQFLRVLSVKKECPLSVEARALWSLRWLKQQFADYKRTAEYERFFLGIARKAYETSIYQLQRESMLGNRGEAILPTKEWLCRGKQTTFQSWTLYLPYAFHEAHLDVWLMLKFFYSHEELQEVGRWHGVSEGGMGRKNHSGVMCWGSLRPAGYRYGRFALRSA